MSAPAPIQDDCTCSLWEPATSENTSRVRYCAPHHAYHRGTKRLDSVTTVIRKCWPIPPSFKEADPAVLENARERGVVCDQLFTAWLQGKLNRIPPTREDSKALFQKLTKWWNDRGYCGWPQVVLADEFIAGTCDIITKERFIWDLKCSYEPMGEPIYELQLGMYALLYEAMYGEPPSGIGIIHVTERYTKPHPYVLDLKSCMSDARHIREVWLISKRRGK